MLSARRKATNDFQVVSLTCPRLRGFLDPRAGKVRKIPLFLCTFRRLASTVERKLRTIVSCGCALCKKLCLTGLIKGLIPCALMIADVASENKTSRISFQICIQLRIVECLCSNLFIAQTVEGNWGKYSLQMHSNLSRGWIPYLKPERSKQKCRRLADRITCNSAPSSAFQDGGRGHLEGLASVYCEILMAPFGEVLMLLEDARRKAWSNRSPKHGAGQGKGYRGSCNQIDTLPNSHSQPLYVPGKYSVSERKSR